MGKGISRILCHFGSPNGFNGIRRSFTHNTGSTGIVLKGREFDKPVPDCDFIGMNTQRKLVFKKLDEDYRGAVGSAFGNGISKMGEFRRELEKETRYHSLQIRAGSPLFRLMVTIHFLVSLRFLVR
jgi:hypothetical protein